MSSNQRTGCYPVYATRYYYNYIYGYTGSFNVSFALDPARLAGLAGDGILNFTTTATSGDLYLRSAGQYLTSW